MRRSRPLGRLGCQRRICVWIHLKFVDLLSLISCPMTCFALVCQFESFAAYRASRTTENYKALQALYDQLKGKGFVVLAFPCNQFGAQEPDTCPVIQKNMNTKFGVTFPIFDKIEVNGDNTAPIFQTIKAALPGDIAWNFEKFLVDKEGKPVKRFKSSWSSSVEEEVAKLL